MIVGYDPRELAIVRIARSKRCLSRSIILIMEKKHSLNASWPDTAERAMELLGELIAELER